MHQTKTSCIGISRYYLVLRILILIHKSMPVQDPTAKARIFNDYFNSTFTRSEFSSQLLEDLPTPAEQLCDISIDTIDVFNALSRLDPTTAVGCDQIHPRVLKFCATSLCEPVTHLYNMCINSGSMPLEWKVHKICPVPKKGNLSNPTNYRPISL